ncbi:MAG: hypothetical protein LBT05_10655 [Planctomycetaceae bacterium]|nr:hypothetical protein [Planctomycetaceae bacterium]
MESCVALQGHHKEKTIARIVIAISFPGPVRNIRVIHYAMIACIGILPLSFICGLIRGIPFGWQLIDCSFDVFGIIPLALNQAKAERP